MEFSAFLNIFGNEGLANLCEQVKDRIAGVDPDTLRPSKVYDPVAQTGETGCRRAQGAVRGLFRAAGGIRPGGSMKTRVTTESARRVSDCVTGLLRSQSFFGSQPGPQAAVRVDDSRQTLASDGQEIHYSPQWVASTDAHLTEASIARVVLASSLKHHTRRGRQGSGTMAEGLAARHARHAARCRFTLPTDVEAWESMSVEETYTRLPEPAEDNSGPNDDPRPDSGMEMPGAAGSGDDVDELDPSDDPGGRNDTGGQENSDGPEMMAIWPMQAFRIWLMMAMMRTNRKMIPQMIPARMTIPISRCLNFLSHRDDPGIAK